MDLVLFGIQGSGKGTQAKKLAEEFGYSIFETGAGLRKIAKTKTPLGKTIKTFIDSGHLAPLAIVMQVVKDAVLSVPQGTKILFDGIPRDTDQMVAFNAIMQEAGRDFQCVQLTLENGTAFDRIRNRAKEQKRADDIDEEAIWRRIQIFENQTIPVIKAYHKAKKLVDVDGSGSIEEVYQELRGKIIA